MYFNVFIICDKKYLKFFKTFFEKSFAKSKQRTTFVFTKQNNMNNSKHFQFILPILGQVMIGNDTITRHAQLEISGIARIDVDEIEYIHTGITPSGDKAAIAGFYAEMEGKTYDQTALHLATMNYLRYDLKGDMTNVLDYTHFSLINRHK